MRSKSERSYGFLIEKNNFDCYIDVIIFIPESIMKNKLILSILISTKLLTSAVNHQDIHDKLSYQNIIVTSGNVSDDFELHNMDAMGAFVQGTKDLLQILAKGLKPYDVFKKSIHLQSLPEDLRTRFFSLPNMPKDIKETTENLCVHVFAYASEAFGKEGDPLFIYATRPAKTDDVITPLSMDDFNYTDALTAYRQTCSLLALLPLNHIQDDTERFNRLKDLADIGIIEAQYICGVMFNIGEGVPQDKAEAFKYYQKAADQGFIETQFICGGMLYSGEGVTKDKAEAFKYYQKAADHGHKKACFECAKALGNFPPYNNLIEKDEDKALEYYKQCSDEILKRESEPGDEQVHKHFMSKVNAAEKKD
ncbi:MAG: hypothetical protein NEHIOOID_00399 [Holosporales bacterium]